jgi:hypothetical protein
MGGIDLVRSNKVSQRFDAALTKLRSINFGFGDDFTFNYRVASESFNCAIQPSSSSPGCFRER